MDRNIEMAAGSNLSPGLSAATRSVTVQEALDSQQNTVNDAFQGVMMLEERLSSIMLHEPTDASKPLAEEIPGNIVERVELNTAGMRKVLAAVERIKRQLQI